MHRDFAFIQVAPNRVFVGWGPFEQLPFRRPERPAFYIADFFLDDPHPWRHPASWEEIIFDGTALRCRRGAAHRMGAAHHRRVPPAARFGEGGDAARYDFLEILVNERQGSSTIRPRLASAAHSPSMFSELGPY